MSFAGRVLQGGVQVRIRLPQAQAGCMSQQHSTGEVLRSVRRRSRHRDDVDRRNSKVATSPKLTCCRCSRRRAVWLQNAPLGCKASGHVP